MRNALIYILLLFVTVLSAQDRDTVADLSGKVIPMKGAFLQQLQERDSVLVADQLLYGFELKQVKEGTGLILPEIPQEQDYRLMYLSPWILDTVKVTKQKNGLPRLLDLRGSVVVSSFEEGLYELPQIVVGRLSEEGVADTLVFEPLRLEVKTMPVDTATFVPHDIKGQIRYPLTFAEIFPWVLGVCAAVLLMIFAIRFIIMRRRAEDPAYAHKDPPHIIALRKLDKYRGSKMWAPEKQKLFYSGVTDTLREYISSRYGVPAMEMTTAQIFDDMKATDAPEALLKEVRELFDRADFVKFAKYVASEEDNASALPVAIRFVTETYQADVENGKEVSDVL
jgi:hypothetical protein